MEHRERTLGTMVATLNESFAGRRVLVTGHTGFKGSWLVALLKALGASVHGYALEPPTTPSLFDEAHLAGDCASHQVGDIRDPSALRVAFERVRPDFVIHLAAAPLVLTSLASPVETFAVNAQGTVHVLEALRASETVAAALMITTDKVYRPRADRACVEDDPLGGEDPYSASKAAAELAVGAYRASYFASGTILASARAGNVIGGGDWAQYRLLPDLARSLQSGQRLVLRHPHAIRPWQHVFDALIGYLLIGMRALQGDRSVARAWNFGPSAPEHLTVAQVVERFVEAYGRRVEVVFDASPLPENPVLMLDAACARADLGWRPQFDVGAAIAASAEFYRKRFDGCDVRSLLYDQIDTFLQRSVQA